MYLEGGGRREDFCDSTQHIQHPVRGIMSGQNANQMSKWPRPCFQHSAVQNETVKHKLKKRKKRKKKKNVQTVNNHQALENFKKKIKAQPQLNQNMNASLTWTICKGTVMWSGYQGNWGRNNGLGTWAMGVTITLSPHSCHFDPHPPSLDFDLVTYLDLASTIWSIPKGIWESSSLTDCSQLRQRELLKEQKIKWNELWSFVIS